MAQLVKCPTLDLDSGHGLKVLQFEPHVGLCSDSQEPACDSLLPSLSSPPLLELVSQDKLKKNKIK